MMNPMTIRFGRATLPAALLLAFAGPAPAHEGHDHAEAATPAVDTAPARPRLVATGDAFELVGSLDGRRLTLWLDRVDDNAPVTDARVELDVGDAKAVAAPAEGGVLVAELPAAPAPGTHAVTATVRAAGVDDLLAGEMRVEAALPAGGTDAVDTAHVERDRLMLAGAAVAAALLGFAAARLSRGRARKGGAA